MATNYPQTYNNKNFSPRDSLQGISRGEDIPPPHNLDIEKSILGAMLLEEDSRHICIEKIQSPKIFFYPEHQKIFSCITELFENKDLEVDILTVSSSLESKGLLKEIGGQEYLIELQSSVATTANVENWCSILVDLSTLRKMISVCSETIEKCYNAEIDNISGMLGDIENSILEAREFDKPTGAAPVKQHVFNAVKYLEKLHTKDVEATGIETGISNLDNIIIGLKQGEMIVIAARPSIGKTSLALNLASNIGVEKKHNVGFFSLEMSAEQLTRRLLCSQAEVSERDFYEKRFDEKEFGKKWSKITKAAQTLQETNIYIDPTPAISISELRAKALRLKLKENLDIIFIDYLQLMNADINRNDTRQVEVSKISVGIKALAKELDIPIVVLAQLNRQADQQERPRLSHLRESGAIEQDADIVMFLHRERDPQKEITYESIDSELIIEKNRNGQTGNAQLLFFPKIMSFKSKSKYSDEDAE